LVAAKSDRHPTPPTPSVCDATGTVSGLGTTVTPGSGVGVAVWVLVGVLVGVFVGVTGVVVLVGVKVAVLIGVFVLVP
jgi:hypothetical protein